MAEHTKGELHRHGEHIHIQNGIIHFAIADCITHGMVTPEEAEANAEHFVRVCNSFDDLLAALVQIVDGDTNPDVGLSFAKGLFHEAAPSWMADAHAAIAKATQEPA